MLGQTKLPQLAELVTVRRSGRVRSQPEKRRIASATVTVADSLIALWESHALDNDGWSHAAAGAHGD